MQPDQFVPTLRRLAAVAFVGVTLLVPPACESGGSSQTVEDAPHPMAMEMLSQALKKRCRTTQILRNVCPMLVPRRPRNSVGAHSEIYPARGIDRWETLDFGWGGANERSPERNRPSRFLHLTIMAGDLFGSSSPFPFPYPTSGPNRSLSDLDLSAASDAMSLGRFDWGQRSGTLILAPSYENGGGIQGGHLIFNWSADGADYAVGLHAWEPVEVAAETLRRIVVSIPES